MNYETDQFMSAQELTQLEMDDAAIAYEQRMHLYTRLVEEIKFTLEGKLVKNNLKIEHIKGRTKTLESFKEKILRKSYKNPISEITDLSGIRIICYYEKDLSIVKSVVENAFEVREDINKSEVLGIDRMGYNGLHLVVQLSADKFSGTRYDGIVGLSCEIQIRTVLQDAWAIISHHLTYKSEEFIPPRIRRDLNNVASLMEIAQGVFDSSRERRENYLVEIETKSLETSMFLEQTVDHDTLRAYTNWKFPEAGVSPIWHDEFLKDLDINKYNNLRKIDEVVERAASKVERYVQSEPQMFQTGTDYITKSFGFEDRDFRSRHNFGRRSIDMFRSADT